MSVHRALPYNSEHLTGPEGEVQRMQERRNCCHCEHLKRRARCGYRGCDLENNINSVMVGIKNCEDFEQR